MKERIIQFQLGYKSNNNIIMKKAILVTIVIVELCMTVLTYLVFDSKNSTFLFSGGSVGSTMKIFGPNFLLVLILYISTVISSFYFRKRSKYLLLCFFIFFTTWFFSGRTIGVYWTGELTTGWFYISTDKVILSKGKDCSGDVIECTTAKNSYLFRLILINGSVEQDVFAGPTIRPALRNYFNKKGSAKGPS
jgi:hypothetical protein